MAKYVSDETGEIDPTIVSGPAGSAARASADVSRADVGFVVGSRPKFTDETADLQRRRLTWAADPADPNQVEL